LSYRIEISNSKELEKNIKAFAKQAAMTIDDAVDIFAHEVRNEAISILDTKKTNNTGRLKQSISVQKTKEGGRRVGTETGYGLYVEFGRGPGKMPPIDVLTRWVELKLKIKGKAAKAVAFMIARKIGKRGTKAQPFLRPAFERTKKRLILDLRKQMAKNA